MANVVLTTGLAMWHKFTATTWSGGNRLPDSSTAATNTGALASGRGLDFDGVNDVVTIGATGTTIKTLILYVWPNTTTQSFLQLQSSGAVRVQIASGTLSATGFTSPTLYVNGVAASTVAASAWQMIAITSATGVAASNVLLGQQNTTFYAGKLANVKAFTTELTAGQIAELYASPEQVLPTGASLSELAGWWPLSEALGAVALNGVVGGKTGAISGATPVTAQTGALPQWAAASVSTPMYFDGTNDVVDFGDVMDIGTASWTYAAWCCVDSSASDNMVMGKYSSVSGGGMAFFAANGFYRAVFSDGTTTTFSSIVTDNTRKYVFVAAVANRSGNLSVYVNGVLENAVSISGMSASNVQNATTFKVGNTFSSTNRWFSGHIAWVSVWNSVLTAAELLALYNSGTPISPTANSGNYVSASSLQAYWLNRGNFLAAWQDLSGQGRHAATISGSPAMCKLPSPGSGKDILQVPTVTTNTGHLVLVGAGYATVADANSLDATTAITIEAWVRPFTVSTTQTICGKNSAYALNITSVAKLQFQRWASTVSGTVSGTASLAVDTWYHVAATYDGTTTKLYINGALDTTSASLTGSVDATATAVILGGLTTASQLFAGRLDSVKIYTSVLTATQVATNYNAERSQFS